MDDRDIQREGLIADEAWEAWKDAELERLWSVHADDIPWTDATSSNEEEETGQ